MLYIASLVPRFLLSRKLRSFLTTLGIAIGVALIFSLISINRGMRNAIEEQFSKMGSDVVTIMGKWVPGSPPQLFTEEELEAVRRVPIVKVASGAATSTLEVEIKGKKEYRPVYGVEPAEMSTIMEDMQGVSIFRGRELRKGDSHKAVVGYDVADKFKLGPGSHIYIQGEKFKVVGVLSEMGSREDDNAIYIPIEDLWELSGMKHGLYTIILAKVREMNTEAIKKAIKRVRGKENFDVLTPSKLVEKVNTILAMIDAVFLAVASVSIIVGGIGVANTMYVAVLERTREIGVMKAIGAKNWQILLMFLLESGLLGLIGGALGIAMGYFFGYAFHIASKLLFGFKTLRPVITPHLLAFSFSFSFFVGLISGIAPAIWASKLQPVEALRYE